MGESQRKSNIKCLRCGGNMEFAGTEKLQLGQYGFLLGSLSNLVSGSLEVEVYCCDACRKLEFYAVDSESAAAGSGIAQAPCPHCGQLHEIDDARCPHCGVRLMD